MLNKTIMICATAIVLGNSFAASVFANDVNGVPPIHWAAQPFNNTSNIFKTGKSFCSKKYIGKKACIPAMNNTEDTLTVSTTDYNSDSAPAGSVVTLMGTGALPSVIFTVVDTDATGKKTTVYSGPANNREGIICSADKTSNAITCGAWK